MKSQDGDMLKHHFKDVHGIQHSCPPIVAASADLTRASHHIIDSLDSNLEDFDSERTLYECIIDDCGFTCPSSQELRAHERTHNQMVKINSSLKYSVIDPDEGIYFVRTTSRGNDFKVHVNLSKRTCSNGSCFNDRTLICRHMRSLNVADNAVEAVNHVIEEDEFEAQNDDGIDGNSLHVKRVIAESKRTQILALQDAANVDCKPFVIECSECPSSVRNFSVFSSNSERAYVKVIFSGREAGNRSTWNCDICPDKCIHIWTCIWIAMINSSNSNIQGSNDQNDFPNKYSK